MINFDWMPTVLSNTGCQFRFYPLVDCRKGVAPDLGQTLWDDVEEFASRHNRLLEDEQFAGIVETLNGKAKRQSWETWGDGCEFVKMRLTVKNFRVPGEQIPHEILGVELAIETTAPGEYYNERGFLLNTQTVLDSAKHAPQ